MSHLIRIPPIHVWYFPSNYGDIRLEDVDAGAKTRVIWYRLTRAEATAMAALRKAATRGIRPWSTSADWEGLASEGKIFAPDSPSEFRIDLRAPLPKVAKVLTRVLRPDRQTVHVMRIGQGKIEEVRTEDLAVDEASEEEAAAQAEQAEQAAAAELAGDPMRREAPEPANDEGVAANEETALANTGTDDLEQVKAATVKKPTRGCPAPSFESVRLRATAVLKAFLNPDQVEDFEKYQRFVTVGADTGHQYMLTSRNAPDQLAHYGSRCVFDLDENRAYCVHDWDVPAEEELLSLHCLLSMPGYEAWARGIPDTEMALPLPL